MLSECIYTSGGGNALEHGTIASTLPTNESTRVDLGYRPKMLIVRVYSSDTDMTQGIYIDDDPTHIYDSRNDWTIYVSNPIPSAYQNNGNLLEVDDTGFTVSKGSSTIKFNAEYWAVK